MRTREAFRGALAQLSGFEPGFDDLPAVGYRLERRPGRALGPRAAYDAVPPACGGETVARAAARMARGEVTAQELIAAAYDEITRRAAELNAFTFLTPRAEAEREAEQLDAERRQGRPRGPLHGIPISIKDVIDVRGMPTTASSKVMDRAPAQKDASAVARLRAAGAVFVGKTSTHEFALGVTTPQSRSPWDPARLPGGSSGGSAIAVATGMSLASLGTDTRASIRVPAALCGVVGFKPTYGLIPTAGVVVLSWGMDHLAPLAKNIADTALMLDVLIPADDRRRSNGASSDPFADALNRSVAGLRIGVPVHGLEGADPAVAAAFAASLDRLRGLGAAVHELDEPSTDDFALANAAGLIVSRAEAAAYHEPWQERRDRYTDDVGEQLDEARRVTAVEYIQAQRYRKELQQRMLHLFERVDALALPTSKVPAPHPEESERLLLVLSENCVPWSFLGFPALSLPCGAAPGNLPIGLELIAAPYDDRLLLTLGSAFESVARISYV